MDYYKGVMIVRNFFTAYRLCIGGMGLFVCLIRALTETNKSTSKQRGIEDFFHK